MNPMQFFALSLKSNSHSRHKMKICLINSSYEGVDSPFEQVCFPDRSFLSTSLTQIQYDELPDPSRYIPKERHEFVTHYVTKGNAKAEIDEICKEHFDMFMNYMVNFNIFDALYSGIILTDLFLSGASNPTMFLELKLPDTSKPREFRSSQIHRLSWQRIKSISRRPPREQVSVSPLTPLENIPRSSSTLTDMDRSV